MDWDALSAALALLTALSLASERLVEIVKNLVPWLNLKHEDPNREGRRRAALQSLAMVAGAVTVFLSSLFLSDLGLPWPKNLWGYLALGLLASGGSGFWNSMATYLGVVKDLRRNEAEASRIRLREAGSIGSLEK